MKLLKMVKDFLAEKKQDTYEFGCVMLYFSFPEINKIHDAINPQDLYEEEEDSTYGLEDEPHTTLLYGIHAGIPLEVIEGIVDRYTFSKCNIGNASLFTNDKYDVLKFDVTGKNLHECNSALRELPHTSTFPDYHPHLTIGYLKPGMGKKYVEIMKRLTFTLIPQYGVYSMPTGEKEKFPIHIENQD